MFNIRKSVYVAYKEDYDFDFGVGKDDRVIYVYPGAKKNRIIEGDHNDPEARGCVGAWDNYGQMIAEGFGAMESNFYSFLGKEERLWVAVQEDVTYNQMFLHVMIEMQHTFNLFGETILEILDFQKAKNYFTGRPVTMDLTEGYNLMYKTFKPTGLLFSTAGELPLEIMLFLYEKGAISKVDADAKIANIAEPMLKSFIYSTVRNIQNDFCVDRKALKEYFGREDINSVDEGIKAIDEDTLLRTLFFQHREIDLHDAAVLADVERFCDICIINDADYPDETPKHRGELQMYLNLFKKPDADVVIKNAVTIFSNGFVSKRRQKFNQLILSSFFDAENPTPGRFELSQVDNEFVWKLIDDSDYVYAVSNTPKIKSEAEEDIKALCRIAPGSIIKEV